MRCMGAKAREVRSGKRPSFRAARLSEDEKAFLRTNARYEGDSTHKAHPGDFGLTPPCSPRQDKTLCDVDGGVSSMTDAMDLFRRAIDGGLVSDTFLGQFPRRIWLVHGERVFEIKLGGKSAGYYHGYPILQNNPHVDDIHVAWRRP